MLAATSVAAERYLPRKGAPATQILLRTLDGQGEVVLSRLRGKKVLLVHFASWDAESRKCVPLWHEQTKPFVAEGKLVVIGVAQEQHADRCRLYAQWQGLDWPIGFDPINLVGIEKLPLAVGIDEHGIVRVIERTAKASFADFVSRKYPEPKQPLPHEDEEFRPPRYTRRLATDSRIASGHMEHGNALIISGGGTAEIDEAVGVYRKVVDLDPKDAGGYFRLGVAHRMRFEGDLARPNDAREAVEWLRRAASRRPSNTVYKRRLEQFSTNPGPQHDFFDWIEIARKEIAARGEKPVELIREPQADRVTIEQPTSQENAEKPQDEKPRKPKAAQPRHRRS